MQIKHRQKSRLTSSCPCPSWTAAVSSPAVPVPSASQLQPFFCWRRSSPPPVPVFSLPDSSFHPGASAWAARTSHEAGDDDDNDGTVHNVRQTSGGMFSSILFHDVSPHLFFLFFQLCFCLLHFVDKHLPHFFLFALQLHNELLPLGFVCLLKADDRKDGNVQFNLKPFMNRTSEQEWTRRL